MYKGKYNARYQVYYAILLFKFYVKHSDDKTDGAAKIEQYPYQYIAPVSAE